MIERIFELFKPSLEGFATVVTYGVGIAIVVACIICMIRLAVNVCDTIDECVDKIKEYTRKRKTGLLAGWRKRVSDCLTDCIATVVSKVLAELVSIADAKKEEAVSNVADLRDKICGWWSDCRGSVIEFYVEKGIYLMKIWRYPDDYKLEDRIFAVRAPFSSGLNSNLFTAISDEAIDFFYGVENDVVYISDFQKMYERFDPMATDKGEVNRPEPFGFEDLRPIEGHIELDPNISKAILDAVKDVDDHYKKDDRTDGININIIE